MGKRRTSAFAYLRVSSAGQLDGHGFERQQNAVDRFAAPNGFRIVEAFRDAHTGTHEARPGFSAMLGAIKANGVRHVLIERLDRFAREIGVQLALLGILQQNGVTLIEASTGRDVTTAMHDDPMAKALVSIQGVFHQAEKELLVRKLRQARDAKRAAQGRCEGVRPYGQDPCRPEEIEVVRLIKRLRRKNSRTGARRGYGAIAAELNQRCVPTRNGGPWSRSSVRAVLARSLQLSGTSGDSRAGTCAPRRDEPESPR